MDPGSWRNDPTAKRYQPTDPLLRVDDPAARMRRSREIDLLESEQAMRQARFDVAMANQGRRRRGGRSFFAFWRTEDTDGADVDGFDLDF